MPESFRADISGIDIGGGMQTVSVWLRQGPIVRIELRSRALERVHARFDLHKHVFIDPLPERPTPEGMGRLSESLMSLVGDQGQF